MRGRFQIKFGMTSNLISAVTLNVRGAEFGDLPISCCCNKKICHPELDSGSSTLGRCCYRYETACVENDEIPDQVRDDICFIV